MAKVVITIDTDEKDDDKNKVIHASIDGEDIANMSSVHIERFGDSIDIQMMTVQKMSDDFTKREVFTAFASHDTLKESLAELEECGLTIRVTYPDDLVDLESILAERGKSHWTRN